MKNKKTISILSLCFITIINFNAFSQYAIEWGKQFGTTSDEVGKILRTDNDGNLYIAGMTDGVLGENKFGDKDGFLARYDSLGNQLWIKQFGSEKQEQINDINFDQQGNCYITGFTKGKLGDESFGKRDIYIAIYNPSGEIIKLYQFGTEKDDVANQIVIDKLNNIFLCGTSKGNLTEENKGDDDCFILKLSSDFKTTFISQFGTDQKDVCSSFALDNNDNIYACGFTKGKLSDNDFENTDGFLVKLSPDGKEIWSKQFGTDSADFFGHIVINNADELYIGGSTQGDFAAKQKGRNQKGYFGDGILLKLDTSGDIIWKRQFGINGWEMIWGIDITPDNESNILVSGCQMMDVCQSYCRVFDKDGNELWKNFFCTTGKEGGTCGKSCSMDLKGNIYHTGNTAGNLFNDQKGKHDVFIVKFYNNNELQ